LFCRCCCLHGRKKKAAAAAPKNKTTPPTTPPAIAPTFLGGDAAIDDEPTNAVGAVVAVLLDEDIDAEDWAEESVFGDVHPSML